MLPSINYEPMATIYTAWLTVACVILFVHARCYWAAQSQQSSLDGNDFDSTVGDVNRLQPSSASTTRHKRRSTDDETPTSAEHELYTMLLEADRYQKHVRPVRNHKSSITVHVGMCVMMIEELVERDQIMVMAACVKMVWVDEFLAWNPENFDNLTWLAISSTAIWLPDIAIINSPEPYSLTKKPTNVDLNYRGEIGYFPSGRLATRCNLQITYFPFDWQHCEVRFESWIYPSQFLEIELYPGDAVDLKEYYVNHQWTVTGYRIASEKADYDGKNFSSITFTFTLRRKSSFYFMYFIFPELLLAMLQTLSHTLPVEHPGRMTMLTALFIGTSVTHAGIASHIPKSSDTMSLLQIYMAIMSINLVFALIITFMMLYTVLRYPNEEPCARAMLSAFFIIVWPSKTRRRRSAMGRMPISYPRTERVIDRFRQEQERRNYKDEYNINESNVKAHRPQRPVSIYDAVLVDEAASKTAGKLASSESRGRLGQGIQSSAQSQNALNHPGELQEIDTNGGTNGNEGGASSTVRVQETHKNPPKPTPRRSKTHQGLSSEQSQSVFTTEGGQAKGDHSHMLVSLVQREGKSSSSSNTYSSVVNAPGTLVASSVGSPYRSQQNQLVLLHQLQKPPPQHPRQLSIVGHDDQVLYNDNIEEAESFAYFDPGDQDPSSTGETSSPGAVSLAVGGATTLYASQQKCIETVSPTNAYTYDSLMLANDASNDTSQSESTCHRSSTMTKRSTQNKAQGVAFLLDNEESKQSSRRRSKGTPPSKGSAGGGFHRRDTVVRQPPTTTIGGCDDHDLKRRWLLYCVALDKSIMYANGIWNITLPIALFWIVPVLHEAMLSPQLDR